MKDKFGLKTSLGIAGASIGMGIAGEAFNSEGLKPMEKKLKGK